MEKIGSTVVLNLNRCGHVSYVPIRLWLGLFSAITGRSHRLRTDIHAGKKRPRRSEVSSVGFERKT